MIPEPLRRIIRPPFAAILTTSLLAAACRPSVDSFELPENACEREFTPISSVQGADETSPLAGERVTVSGVITRVQADGLYLEQPGADASPETSDALYLALPSAKARPGQWYVAQGTVRELGDGDDTLTALTDISAYRACARNVAIPLTDFSLPHDERDRESREAMHLRLGQDLFISNPRDIAEGDVLLSLEGILPSPTEVARPGGDARAQSEWNRRHSLPARLHASDRTPVPAGTQVFSVQGVLGHDGEALRLLADESAHLRPPPTYRVESPAAGDLRIASLNLLNYFNGDGQGGGFPTPRGAETVAGFARQRARLAAQVAELSPHLVAAMELENDGFGPLSAAADMVSDLEGATGERWQPAMPWSGPIGDDQITVGLFYQPARLTPLGPAEVLTGPDFERLSRHPLAQAFSDRATGEIFLVVINHLKSKGSCPQSGRNANLSDGQGCWNEARTSAARAMARWALALADDRAAGRVLVVGDMNAYRMEDPITALLDTGLRDLTAPAGPRPNFSYIYRGEAGTLDYAFASAALAPLVQSARIVNINSPWPLRQDLPLDWLGASDHDPVLVDLRFRKAATRD